MPLPKDCVTPMLSFADRFLNEDGVLAMASFMGPFLVARFAGESPKIVDLGKLLERYGIRKFSLGRAENCGIQFIDSNVSSKHAEVIFSRGNWCIVDRGSTNGTFAEAQLAPNVERPLQEDMIFSLAQVVEIEFMTTTKFRDEFDQRAKNRKATRRLTSQRYAKLRNTTRRSRSIMTGKALDLLSFATRTAAMRASEFRTHFPQPVLVLLGVVPFTNLPEGADTQVCEAILDGGGMRNLKFWPIASRSGADEIVFGREKNADLVLPHQTISKKHAQFERDEFLDEWLIEDLSLIHI